MNCPKCKGKADDWENTVDGATFICRKCKIVFTIHLNMTGNKDIFQERRPMEKIDRKIREQIREKLEAELWVGLGYKNLNGAWVAIKKLKVQTVGVRKYLVSGEKHYGILDMGDGSSERHKETFSGVAVEI